jgi:hypothetical protein
MIRVIDQDVPTTATTKLAIEGLKDFRIVGV